MWPTPPLIEAKDVDHSGDCTTRVCVERKRNAFAAWMPQLCGQTMSGGCASVYLARRFVYITFYFENASQTACRCRFSATSTSTSDHKTPATCIEATPCRRLCSAVSKNRLAYLKPGRTLKSTQSGLTQQTRRSRSRPLRVQVLARPLCRSNS